MYKSAVLIMPEEVVCKIGSAAYELSGEMSFRWDEPIPLTIRLWRKGWGPKDSDKADQLMGHAVFFDEEGNEVPQWSVVTSPPPSTGEAVIQSGEHRKFGFFAWNQYAQFPRPGKYCVVAEFWGAAMGKTTVVFRTARRWFRVVEAPPDPKKEKL